MNASPIVRKSILVIFLQAFLVLFGLSPLARARQEATAAAPAERAAKIDAYVDGEMKRFHIPGMALAVVRRGEVLYAKGFGFANLEHQVPVKRETVFQSGSTGKQYTAMAVLMLAEEGKIKLDESIRTYFLDAPPSWQPITIRHILNHISGLGDYTAAFDLRKNFSETELRNLIYRTPLGFKPGERFRYSNLGYATLGTLISKISGKFYGDFLKERIFAPLGMATAGIINESDIIPNRAAGYLWRGKEWKNQEWVSPTFNSTADGSLYLTLDDVAKWDAALSAGKLVGRALLDQAFTSGKLNDGKETGYGFGWSIARINGRRLIEHGGAWQGFMAMISRYVDDDFTVIVFANLQGAPVERIAHAVAGLWEPSLAQSAPAPVEDKEPEVTAVLKKRIGELAAGTCRPEIFAKPFAADFFPEGAAQVKGLLGELGPITGMTLVERKDEEGGIRLYRYMVAFGETRMQFQFRLDKDGLIVRLGIRPE